MLEGEDISKHTNAMCHVSHFSIQEEDILEHSNANL